MITYLGSGIPILYHGPVDSAAYQLLRQHGAALMHASLEVTPLAELLRQFLRVPQIGRTIAEEALKLARSRFLLEQQRRVFWTRVGNVLSQRDVTLPVAASAAHAEHAGI